MGASGSAFEVSKVKYDTPQAFSTRSANGSCKEDAEDDLFISRKSRRSSANPRLVRYACPSSDSMSSVNLPGQVRESETFTEEDLLSDGSFEGYPRGFLAISEYFQTEKNIVKTKMSELGSRKLLYCQSFDSIRERNADCNKKLIAACERPKRIKSAMFEAFLGAVSPMYRSDSRKKSKHSGKKRLRISSASHAYSFSGENVEFEEAPYDYLAKATPQASNGSMKNVFPVSKSKASQCCVAVSVHKENSLPLIDNEETIEAADTDNPQGDQLKQA